MMVTKLAAVSLSLVSLFVPLAAQANNEDSCYIQMAVSTPPITLNQIVSFNVVNEYGYSRSLSLTGGSAPQFIDYLLCGAYSYTVSATVYSIPANGNVGNNGAIGNCTLKAGPISLNGAGNNISVVFPNDFVCDNHN